MVFAEFARQHAEIFPRYGHHYRPRTSEIIGIGRGVGDAELEHLREHCLLLREELGAVMAAAAIDAWICPPALGPAPVGLHATGDPNMNLPWTHAGMPAVTVPAGTAANGLPLGLQLVARYDEDESLLAWALALEPLLAAQA
jgi:Asp-tRNA(Asn)/Glu-tRNA(Gln) amidotransferase A subunit family amidase